MHSFNARFSQVFNKTNRPAIRQALSNIVNSLRFWARVMIFLPSVSSVTFAQLHDPTQPGHLDRPSVVETAAGEVVVPSESLLKVTEIWISDTERRAIIDGISVRAGQRIDEDTQVLKIMPRHVIVKRRGETQTLHLVPSVKTR